MNTVIRPNTWHRMSVALAAALLAMGASSVTVLGQGRDRGSRGDRSESGPARDGGSRSGGGWPAQDRGSQSGRDEVKAPRDGGSSGSQTRERSESRDRGVPSGLDRSRKDDGGNRDRGVPSSLDRGRTGGDQGRDTGSIWDRTRNQGSIGNRGRTTDGNNQGNSGNDRGRYQGNDRGNNQGNSGDDRGRYQGNDRGNNQGDSGNDRGRYQGNDRGNNQGNSGNDRGRYQGNDRGNNQGNSGNDRGRYQGNDRGGNQGNSGNDRGRYQGNDRGNENRGNGGDDRGRYQGTSDRPRHDRADDLFTRSAEGRRFRYGVQARPAHYYTETYLSFWFPHHYSYYPYYYSAYEPCSYYSPFYVYYGSCPPYILRRHTFFVPPPVIYIEVPIYVGSECRGYDKDDDYYLSRGSLRDDRIYGDRDLTDAMYDLEDAFAKSNIELLGNITDEGVRISIFHRGKYDYSLSSGDYLDMTRDAFRSMDTVGFEVLRVRRRTDRVFSVSARHDYRTRDGARRSVYVSFAIERIRDRWVITQVDTSPDRWQ